MDVYNKMIRKQTLAIAAFFAALALVGFSSAAGVATSIWQENPLKVNPGQEGYIEIWLQNMVGDEDLIFEIEYEDNPGGVTRLDRMRYEVSSGRSDVLVKLNYNIPEDAPIGQIYNVRLLFRATNPDVTGGIRSVPAFGRVFPIHVVEEEVQPSPQEDVGASYAFVWYLVAVLVIVGVVVYFVMKRKK